MTGVDLDAVFPPMGRCSICGDPDARHRVFDAIRGRYAAGETSHDLAADYEVSVPAILAVLNGNPEPQTVPVPPLSKSQRKRLAVQMALAPSEAERKLIADADTIYDESGIAVGAAGPLRDKNSTIDVCRALYPFAEAWRDTVFASEQMDGEIEAEHCRAELAALDAFLARCCELGLDQ